jgi:hypothetical protein
MQRAVALVTLQVNRFPFPSDIQHALQTIQAVQAILTAEQNQGQQA